jgi:hypothetical protein
VRWRAYDKWLQSGCTHTEMLVAHATLRIHDKLVQYWLDLIHSFVATMTVVLYVGSQQLYE